MRDPASPQNELASSPASPPGRRASLWVWLALAVVSVLPLLPLRLGIPDAHDLPDHTAMATEFRNGLAEGRLYPRWCGDFSWGWGDATGQYYPPALYYVTALTSTLVGGPIVHGLFAALALLTLVGMIGTYRLVRAVAGRRAGLLGCLFFALAPYRYFEMYAAGLLSAYAAGCILPWFLLSLWKLAKTDSRGVFGGFIRPACTFAPLYALVALTNMPLVVMMTYTVAAWAAVETLVTRNWRIPARAALGGILGALMAAAYLLPVAMELSYIQPAIENDQELFRSNFVFQGEGSWMNPGLRGVFTHTGALEVLLLALSGGWLLWYTRPRRGAEPGRNAASIDRVWIRLVAAFGVCAALLATPVSLPLWEVLPFLKKIYLPWRFLDPLALCLAALTGAGLAAALTSRNALPRPARIVYVAAVSLLGLNCFTLASSISRMNGQISAGAAATLPLRFYERRSYHLPRTAASPEKLIHSPPFGVRPRTTSVEILKWSTSRRRFRIAAKEPAVLALRTFYFPGWRAVDASTGEPFPTRAQPPLGAVAVELPPGNREIVVSFEATPPRTAGAILSLLAWLAWAGIVLSARRSRRPRDPSPPSCESSERPPVRQEVLA